MARGHAGAVLSRPPPPLLPGGLFFTSVVCEHSFVAKKLPSHCSESKDKAAVKITPYFDSSQIITTNDPFSSLSHMLINVV